MIELILIVTQNQRNVCQTKILANENCHCADHQKERILSFALHTTFGYLRCGGGFIRQPVPQLINDLQVEDKHKG